MINKLRTMISKWVIEDKLNDMQIGAQIRKHYWREIHSYEHWMNDEYEEGGDMMAGGSSVYDDGEDEIY